MIGKQLNHYKILDKLGEGGMGAVYLAEDVRLNRKVALKLLPGDMAQDPERLKRFEREAKVVASINHPNIVTLYSVEEADGVKFITMELVDGDTVGDLLPENGFSLEEFFDISIPLVEALGAAHAKGITHRDLKPANVMVTKDQRVKILDFGVAKLQAPEGAEGDVGMATQELTQQGTFLGTVAYMAPEQVKGDAPDHRSDIFALGIILYQLATGKRPFSAESPAEVISSILRDEPTPITEIKVDLPYHLGRIVRRCLEKNPELRYQQTAELRNDLRNLRREVDAGEIEAATVVGARLPQMPTPETGPVATASETPAKSFKMPLLIGGAAVVVAAIVAGLLLRPGTQPEPAAEPVAAATPAAEEPAEAAPVVLRDDLVAVMHFNSLGDVLDEAFADSLANDLSGLLTSLPNLNVISQNRTARETTDGSRPIEAAARLGAAHILEGTIRWVEPAVEGGFPRLRANLQMTRTRDEIQVWSQSFDRTLDDPLRVQSDISYRAAKAIGTTLLGELPEETLARWDAALAPPESVPPATPDALATPEAVAVAQVEPSLGATEVPTTAAGGRGAQPSVEPAQPTPQAQPPARTYSTPPVTQPAPTARQAPPPVDRLAGMGRVIVDFASEKLGGTLTVYADDQQVMQSAFEGKKGGFFGKVQRGFKGSEADELSFTREVPVTRRAHELRVIVVLKEKTAPVKLLTIDFRQADTWQLVVRVGEKGVVETGLRPWG
jgi:TolB-like protein